MSEAKVKGYVQFFNQKEPVTWERETSRYVFGVKRLKKENHSWKKHRRYFDEKMDKQEIFDGQFKFEYPEITAAKIAKGE